MNPYHIRKRLCHSDTPNHSTPTNIVVLLHRVKIVTGGNHDFDLDDRFNNVTNKQEILACMEQAGITYLEHEPYQLPEILGGFKMFVSPYAPMHLGGAFMPRNLTRNYGIEDINIINRY